MEILKYLKTALKYTTQVNAFTSTTVKLTASRVLILTILDTVYLYLFI